MGKMLVWFILIAAIMGGYNVYVSQHPGNTHNSNLSKYTYQPRGYYQQKSASAKENTDRKRIILQRTVAACAKSLKASGMRCNLTPEEMAYCFSRKMFGSIYEGASIRMRSGDEWNFFADGSCGKRGECRVVITSLGKNYAIDLYLDRSGYITADNPTIKRK